MAHYVGLGSNLAKENELEGNLQDFPSTRIVKMYYTRFPISFYFTLSKISFFPLFLVL